MLLMTLYCKALGDVKFSKIEGNGRKFRHIQISNSFISLIFYQWMPDLLQETIRTVVHLCLYPIIQNYLIFMHGHSYCSLAPDS